jgi:hypothetical protein
VEPGTASRRLDFESTTGGGALRAISAPDINQLPRACLGEGDMLDTDDSASGGSPADLIKVLRANANRDRRELEILTISLRKSYELSDMQKQLMTSILKKNERLTTQNVALQESEAALRALVGPGAAKGAGRSAASKKQKRESEELFQAELSPLQRDIVNIVRFYAADIARSIVHYITPWPVSSGGLVDYAWYPTPLKIAEGDGTGPLRGGSRAPQPPLGVAKLGLSAGALTAPVRTASDLARIAFARARAEGKLTSALEAATAESVQAACSLRGGDSLKDEVVAQASAAMGNLKRKVRKLLRNRWCSKSPLSSKEISEATDLGAMIQLWKDATDIDCSIMGAVFGTGNSDMLSHTRSCVDAIGSKELRRWRVATPASAKEGADNFASAYRGGVDTLFSCEAAGSHL